MREENIIVYHGTAAPPFADLADRQTWFAEKASDADEYRLASLLKEADGVELPEDTYDINELGILGIKSILDEEGIDQNGGRVIMASLSPIKVFDINEVTSGQVNISNVPISWSRINQLGAVNEPWETLDEEYQHEIIDRFAGKAWWSFLEELDVYTWLKTKGYDAVKILDVNMSGREHVAYLALNPEIITVIEEDFKPSPQQRKSQP